MTSLREIRILQQLDHENIVPIVEICRAKGKVCMCVCVRGRISLALPTLYPKSRVVGSGLIRYLELCTVTYPIRMRFELLTRVPGGKNKLL